MYPPSVMGTPSSHAVADSAVDTTPAKFPRSGDLETKSEKGWGKDEGRGQNRDTLVKVHQVNHEHAPATWSPTTTNPYNPPKPVSHQVTPSPFILSIHLNTLKRGPDTIVLAKQNIEAKNNSKH